MITRRALVASAVAGLASAPWAARAQKPRPLRLGYLGSAYRRDLRINAIAQRLPTIGHLRDLAGDGFLLSYGPNFVATFRRAATYVSRIARGAKPADLAVERATTLELLANLRTASAIGVTIPPPLLARADDILR